MDGSSMLSARFASAMQYALLLHRNQVRKVAGIPYFSHLMSVSALVVENGGDEDEAIAALLHDAVEDQGGADQLAQIRKLFGDRIADMVLGCTDTDVSNAEQERDWRNRKDAHIQRLRTEASPEVLRIMAADKLHNARSILQDLRKSGPDAFTRFAQGRAGTLWYYSEMSRVMTARLGGYLAEELDRVVHKISSKAAGFLETAIESHEGSLVLGEWTFDGRCFFWFLKMTRPELEEWWSRQETFEDNPPESEENMKILTSIFGEPTVQRPVWTLEWPGEWVAAESEEDEDLWVKLNDCHRFHRCSIADDVYSILTTPEGRSIYHKGYKGDRDDSSLIDRNGDAGNT